VHSSLLSGQFLNQLVRDGEYFFEKPGRSARSGQVIWWGMDNRFIFQADGRLWMAWVAGSVTEIDMYEFECVWSAS
jgi:hypothetical protein